MICLVPRIISGELSQDDDQKLTTALRTSELGLPRPLEGCEIIWLIET